MSPEQLAQLKASCDTITNVTVNEAGGGWIIAGQIQFVDRATQQVVGEKNDRHIATNTTDAFTVGKNYADTGDFNRVLVPVLKETDPTVRDVSVDPFGGIDPIGGRFNTPPVGDGPVI